MNRSCRRLVFAMALLATPAVLPAQPTASTPGAGFTLPSTHIWDMAAPNGEIYRIFVSFPADGRAPPGGYPVLYVLDGNSAFAGFAEARRAQEGDPEGRSIIVGVGYPTDQPYDLRRNYDLTGGPTELGAYVKTNSRRNGGWDLFLDFLVGPLRQEIGRRYSIDPARQALFGHSLGGLFAIHSLYRRPDAFEAIIAASAATSWHDRRMQREERDFVVRLQAGKIPRVARVMMVQGEREEDLLDRWDPEDFAERMMPLSAHGLRITSETYVGEGHMTVPNRAVTDTLRFVATHR